MNITINGLQIGNGTNFQIESPVEGFETPPIRQSSDDYSGRDGGVITGHFYSPRLITISGHIIGQTADQHETLRQTLQAAMPIRQALDLQLTTFSSDVYTTSVKLLDFKMPYIHPRASRFKIDLFAGDPYLYSSDIFESILTKYVGGGFILPVTLPITFDPGSSPTVVNNGGTVETYPTFTIDGAATNPVITNVDTGEKVELSPLSMSTGDILVIDMRNRTITLNGSSVLYLRSEDSDWFTLAVGSNRFRYDTDDVNDDGEATVSWQNAIVSA